MKIRFTMRDAMWLLVLLGLAVAFGVDRYWHRIIDDQNKRLKADYEILRQNDDRRTTEIWDLKDEMRELYQAVHRLEEKENAASAK
jgi:hypothetical protein